MPRADKDSSADMAQYQIVGQVSDKRIIDKIHDVFNEAKADWDDLVLDKYETMLNTGKITDEDYADVMDYGDVDDSKYEIHVPNGLVWSKKDSNEVSLEIWYNKEYCGGMAIPNVRL